MRTALGGMCNIPHWFVWRLTWSEEKRKYTKVPCFPSGIEALMNAKDPANWHTYIDAWDILDVLRAGDSVRKYTLGFYFTADCGYWFIDADECYNPDTQTFSATSLWVYQQLPGAAFEYSSSGRGFHLFGRGAVPPHRAQPTGLDVALYTEGRGVALGLTGEFHGCADTDLGSQMRHVVVPQYFAPTAPAAPATGTSGASGPRADWRGPTDDDDLLRRARRAVSASAAFSGGATFADLFDGNMPVLQRVYKGDDSACDSALASHLAFWTGCDIDRIERLMRRSALARDKWDSHRTYLREFTITNACAIITKVCCDRELAQPIAEASDTVEVGAILSPDAQRVLFHGCAYVRCDHKIMVPVGGAVEMMSPEVFNAHFGGYSFVLDKGNTKTTRKAFDAFILSEAIPFPKVSATMYRPDMPCGEVFAAEGISYVNNYIEPRIVRKAGDITPFLAHIAKLLPDVRDQEIFKAYIAAIVQHKGVKFTWCVVLQGTQGNGKSTIGRCLQYAVGSRHFYSPSVDDLSNKFNAWMRDKILFPVNDVWLPEDQADIMEHLKPMITEADLRIEGKGKEQGMQKVCGNFIFFINKMDGIKNSANERRYCIFYCAQQRKGDLERDGMDRAYFLTLRRWLDNDGYAIVADWLHTYPIPEHLNPAKSATVAPETSGEHISAQMRLSTLDVLVQDAIDEGRQGFRGGWICWQRLDTLLAEKGYGKIPFRRREEILENLGYILHPGLGSAKSKTLGYTDNPMMGEGGKKAKLYVVRGHETINSEISKGQIAKNYEISQMEIFSK